MQLCSSTTLATVEFYKCHETDDWYSAVMFSDLVTTNRSSDCQVAMSGLLWSVMIWCPGNNLALVTTGNWSVGLYKYDFFLIFIILHGLINASIWVDSENIWMEPPAFVKNVRTSSKDWAFCSKNRYLDMRFWDILQHLTTKTSQRCRIVFSLNGVEQNWSKLIEQLTDA